MGTFSAKMVYERVKGWTSGRSLPELSSPQRGGLVVIEDFECVRRRNFNTDTFNDFPI